MKKLGLFNFSHSVPASGAQLEGEESKLFRPQDCCVSPHSATSGEQGRGDTLFSQLLGGGAGMTTLKALSQNRVSPY